MKALQSNATINTRLLSLDGLKDYLSLGRSSAEKVAKEAGARLKIGTRTVFDREKIDAYLDTLTDSETV